MIKKYNLLAFACYIAIPAVVIVGGGIAVAINPELAHRTSNYSFYWHALDSLKRITLLGSFAVAGLLWLVTCALVIKSKSRSWGWLAFAFLGPLGITALAMLKDADPSPDDRYEALLNRLPALARWAFHAALLWGVWSAGYALMVIYRNLQIAWEAARTGQTIAQVMAVQSASSGMWAFGESLIVFFIVPLIYFLLPPVFNIAAWLIARARSRGPSAGPAS